MARAALGFALLSLLCALPVPVYAVNASAFLSGTVTREGHPAGGIEVTASGNNLTVRTSTDAKGRFAFPPLALGTYDVEARRGDLRGLVRVDLGSGGAAISVALVKLSEIEHTVVTHSQSLALHGSGSDVVLNGTALTRLPFNNSFTRMELQMPGAAQGANGVVHINGD
ncbi:MAG: carboxypeptidase regulatory-like domain-containing protein, partial [Candidatus Eremiobacteraeota bacterium]|nr:carboxypeptidase regulatory-like domain-containing protein [Candidatus Eremiobacteraeota bacterium]